MSFFRSKVTGSKPNKFQPQMEALEERALMSVSALWFGYGPNVPFGQLQVIGDGADDRVSLSQGPNGELRLSAGTGTGPLSPVPIQKINTAWNSKP